MIMAGTSWGSDWIRLLKEPVIVWCHKDDVNNGRRVLAIVEDALPEISRDLGLNMMRRIQIFLVLSQSEFTVLTRGQIPEWGAGAAVPSDASIILKSPRFIGPDAKLRRVVLHELSHVLLWMASAGQPVARWFDEGLAQVTTGESGRGSGILLARALLTGNLVRLEEVDDVLNFQKDRAALAYEVSRTAVEYLIDSFGKESIARLAMAVSDGRSMDEALFLVTGTGMDTFQENWHRYIKTRYRWYVLLDFPLILSLSMLLLFFAALFATRWRVRQKRKAWEEGWGPGIEEWEEESTSA